MRKVPLGVLILIATMHSQPTFASSCQYARADLKSAAKTPEEFFKLPSGAIAIGELCDSATNICQKNYVVTGCAEVEYPVMEFEDPSISIVFNSSKNCSASSSCPTENSYLAAAAVYVNNPESFINLPKVEAIRNPGWYKPRSFSREYRIQFNKVIKDDKASKFFSIQTKKTSTLESFESEVVRFFHATPEQGNDESWTNREVFGAAFSNLERCRSSKNICTLKAYLIKFSETQTGVPSIAVRINAALARADGIEIRTVSPLSSSAFNTHLRINFKWPQ